MNTQVSLASLGWRSHFQSQFDSSGDEIAARVVCVHRSIVDVIGEGGEFKIESAHRDASAGITVGDWVILDPDAQIIRRRLEPFAMFRRRAAGTSGDIQSIAANIDTVFIVTSANRDFNIARLERYLAIARDAGVFPVIVVTKADLVESVQETIQSASKLSPGLLVEAMDARDVGQVGVLKSWCDVGQTVALLGSSGVGKSTLINALTGSTQQTSAARDDDQRGRHTTTGRSMHRLSDGGWLIDTPGMRELQLVDVGDGLTQVFSDITEVAERCRFKDCTHSGEPGCAVQLAIAHDELDANRLGRYKKLLAEDRRNTESLADRRYRDKSLAKLYKSVQSDMRGRKGGG